ncbi:LapA family protein [Kitasatospora sp. NPDC101157]
MNTTEVSVRLWFSTVMAPLWLILVVTSPVGAVIGWPMNRRESRHLRN